MKEQTSYRKELTGVFGYPVDENPTVVMIEAGFAALNLPWRYLNLKVPPKDLPSAVNGLRAMGFRGINLTIPHKCEVIKYLDEVADDARIMGAVNTVYVQDGRLIGANTDGKGFLRALNDDAKLNPAGKKFVVLGAGGAARAITVELALAGAAEIVIVNRSEARGWDLVALLLNHTGAHATYQPWSDNLAIPEGTDVLVNATSIGLYPDVTTCRRLITRRSSPAWSCATSFPTRRKRVFSTPPRSAARSRSTGSACWFTRARSPSSCGRATTPRSR
jgi:shikimate dehydrogenase